MTAVLDYYADKLSADRLRHVYEIAPPRIRQYLDAELEHLLAHIDKSDRVLELGCGYGRILPQLAEHAGEVIGIDTSQESLDLAQQMISHLPSCSVQRMNAASLTFPDHCFDVVACIQNGISAFHVDPLRLITESLRVTKPGGVAVFSSYAESFWEERLNWFRLQAAEGLLGAIDEERTGDGIIVCRDGFTATTVSPERFRHLTTSLNAEVEIMEVDNSSLFCEISPK